MESPKSGGGHRRSHSQSAGISDHRRSSLVESKVVPKIELANIGAILASSMVRPNSEETLEFDPPQEGEGTIPNNY